MNKPTEHLYVISRLTMVGLKTENSSIILKASYNFECNFGAKFLFMDVVAT